MVLTLRSAVPAAKRWRFFFLDWVLGVLVGWIWFIETMKWKSRCGIAKDWGEVKMKIEIWQKWCLMSGVHIHLACLSGFAGLWFWLGADGYWFLQRKERSNAVITDVSEWVSALAPEAPNYPQPGELLETSAERRKRKTLGSPPTTVRGLLFSTSSSVIWEKGKLNTLYAFKKGNVRVSEPINVATLLKRDNL